jgi:hypothetical protein
MSYKLLTSSLFKSKYFPDQKPKIFNIIEELYKGRKLLIFIPSAPYYMSWDSSVSTVTRLENPGIRV